MRWIATLWDIIGYVTYAMAFGAMTLGMTAIHAPDVLQAYPQDLPAMTEDEAFVTMDTRPWP